jgi:hypothetical protein
MTTLAPTAECSKQNGATYISIKYAVNIVARILGSEDIVLSLPFVIMSQQPDMYANVPHDLNRVVSNRFGLRENDTCHPPPGLKEGRGGGWGRVFP